MKRLGMILILALIVAKNCVFVLPEGQQAVVLQFGRPVTGAVTRTGLHFKLPLIQAVRFFEQRFLIWDGDPNQIPTAGREFIWVDATARWRIKDPVLFLQTVQDEGGAQSRLGDILDSVVRDQISSFPLVELIRSSSWKPAARDAEDELAEDVLDEVRKPIRIGREGLTRKMLAGVQKMTESYGIHVVDLRIKRVNYVESVREKVYKRMISERQRVAARFRSEGEGRSAEIIGHMERELRKLRSDAYRQSQEIRGRGEATATQVYGDAYALEPAFFRFVRGLDTLRESAGPSMVLVLTTASEVFRPLLAPTSAPPPVTP